MEENGAMYFNERQKGKDFVGVEDWAPERPANSEMGRMMKLRERGGGGLRIVQERLARPIEETRIRGESHTFLSGDEARDLMMSVVEEGVLAQYGLSAKNPELSIKGSQVEFIASVAYKNSPAVRVALEMESQDGRLITRKFGGKGLGQDALLNIGLKAAGAATGIDVRAEMEKVLENPQQVIRDAIAPIFEEKGADLREVDVEIGERSGVPGFKLNFRGKIEEPVVQAQSASEKKSDLVSERGEKWAGKVKNWVIGQYGPRGYQFISPGEKDDAAFNHPLTDAMLGFYRHMGLDSLHSPEEIRVLSVPIENSGLKQEVRNKNRSMYPDGSELVVFSYKGKDTDASHRNGEFSSVFVMSKNDSKAFLEEVNKDPRLLFELATAVRGKPPTRYDGQPMEIFISGSPTILANDKYGGDRTKDMQTVGTFPERYRPFYDKYMPTEPKPEKEPVRQDQKRPERVSSPQQQRVPEQKKRTEEMNVNELRMELSEETQLLPGREAALKNQLRFKIRDLNDICSQSLGKSLKELVTRRVGEIIAGGDNDPPFDEVRAALSRSSPELARLYMVIVMDEVAFYKLAEKSGQPDPDRRKLERVRIPIIENEDRKIIKNEVGMNRVLQNPGVLFSREGRLRFSEVVGHEAEILDRIVESTDEEVRFGAAAKFWQTVTAETGTASAWGKKANEVVVKLKGWIKAPDFVGAGVRERVDRLARELDNHLPGGSPELKKGYALAVVSLESGANSLDQNVAKLARECLLFDF
jgi:hypothetical protein